MILPRRAFLGGAALLTALRSVDRLRLGLDRVPEERWKGRRVGILAHGASYSSDGRFVADVFRDAGARVLRLFAPEHGLQGLAAAGERVDDAARNGVPVVSLYGARRVPERAHLADLDLLVADLQDVGVRFYTYAATLLDTLDAAGDLPCLVLDRPNPLGGEMVDGPLAQGPASIFNRVPGPLIHGLTMGEIARLARPATRVLALQGWTRAQRWPGTGLAWRPPSPNLRTAGAALVYPGVALLEATNVSEGRGTDAPFLTFGAPWLDDTLVERIGPVDGCALQVARFHADRFPGIECRGARIRVTDPDLVQPWQLGRRLVAALGTWPQFAWTDGHVERLLGTPDARRAIEHDVTPQSLRQWREERKPALLY